MRQKNLRVVFTGIGLIVLAGAFFLGMITMAPKSNDPVSMMQTVGTVSGVAAGVGVAMIIFGLIGKKQQA